MINLKLTPTARALMAADIIGNPLAGVPTPSLDLDFVNSSTLDSRVTFTRASDATYFDSSGVLQTAASGVARFDHNPTTGESLGLLVEEQRTNLVLQSEDFGTTWGQSTSPSLSTNTHIAPDGALTADTIGSSAAISFFSQNITFTGDGDKSYSIFLKAGTSDRTAVRVRDTVAGVDRGSAFIVWTAGVPSVTVTNGSLQAAQSVGNGWYRIQITVSSVVAANTNQMRILPDSLNGTGNVIAWGVQAENGAFPTSYIPTVASQATRNADVASMTGTNFSSWYRADEGTLYAEASTYDVSGGRTPFSITDGTVQNRIQVNASTSPKAFVAASGVTQLSQTIPSVTYTNNTFSKTALAYKTNDANAAANGTIGTDDTSITIPTVSEAGLGKVGAASNILNGTIRKIAFYRTRLSNAQLVALTR